MSQMPGGKADVRGADPDSKEIAASVRGAVENRVGKTYGSWEVICYRTQVVAGVNYFIKVKVGDNSYIHITVWKRLPHENKGNELTNVEENKTLDDPL